MTSLIMRVELRDSDDEINEKVHDWFVPETVALSAMLDRAAIGGGDFWIDTAQPLEQWIGAAAAAAAAFEKTPTTPGTL